MTAVNSSPAAESVVPEQLQEEADDEDGAALTVEPEPEPEPEQQLGPLLRRTITAAPNVLTNVLARFGFTGKVIDWAVPAGCTQLDITACGASSTARGRHALGAKLRGRVEVTPGETMLVLVGSQPRDRCEATGDGGSTYVVRASDGKPILIASGGAASAPSAAQELSAESQKLPRPGQVGEIRMLPNGPGEIYLTVSHSVVRSTTKRAPDSPGTKFARIRTRDIPPLLVDATPPGCAKWTPQEDTILKNAVKTEQLAPSVVCDSDCNCDLWTRVQAKYYDSTPSKPDETNRRRPRPPHCSVRDVGQLRNRYLRICSTSEKKNVPPLVSSQEAVGKKTTKSLRHGGMRTVKIPLVLRREERTNVAVHQPPGTVVVGQVVTLASSPHLQGTVVAEGIQQWEDRYSADRCSDDQLRAQLISHSVTQSPLEDRKALLEKLKQVWRECAQVDFGEGMVDPHTGDHRLYPLHSLRILGGSGFKLADGTRRTLPNGISANACADPDSEPHTQELASVVITAAMAVEVPKPKPRKVKLHHSQTWSSQSDQPDRDPPLPDRHAQKVVTSMRKALIKEAKTAEAALKAAEDAATQAEQLAERLAKAQPSVGEGGELTTTAALQQIALLEAQRDAAAKRVAMHEVEQRTSSCTLCLAAEIHGLEEAARGPGEPPLKPEQTAWAVLDKIHPGASDSEIGWRKFYREKGLPPRVVHLRLLPALEIRTRQLTALEDFVPRRTRATDEDSEGQQVKAKPKVMCTQVALTNITDEPRSVTVVWQQLALPPCVNADGLPVFQYSTEEDVPAHGTHFVQHRALVQPRVRVAPAFE
jgi:hypothetical protein